jgi:ABC-type transporter Mla subunit MlaD
MVDQMADATNQLEGRVRQLQEALAEPMKLIDDARAQADELNGISLIVKRVFQGISKASLEANQRVRTLGALLSRADQWSASAKQSLAQWIAEANRAQQRLSTTLETVPPPSKTHPLTSLPSLGDKKLERSIAPLPKSESPARPSRMNASDIQQMLDEARTRAAATA